MQEAHKWNAADSITSIRIISSLALIFLMPESRWFLIVYTFAGLTDVLDGWLARKMKMLSSFGARLDSIADLVFYSIMFIRISPILRQILPREIGYAIIVILLVRLSAYGTAAVKYHCFASMHTWLNKLTGAAVFLLPYVLVLSSSVLYCGGVCVLAFTSSLEELVIHLKREHYCENVKSIFQRIKE